MQLTGDSTRTRHRLAGVALALVVPLTLTACFGSDDDDAPVPDGPLGEAQARLSDTSGVAVTMTATKLPKGVDGVRTLEGTLTAAPAFEGELDVTVNDIEATLPMVAVDGAVYARLPFTESYVEIDPAAYGSPDPAELLDPEHGLAGWLAQATGVEESDDGRTVTGVVPAAVVAEAIPSARARGTFDAEFRLDDDGALDAATITGPFYGRAGVVTYEVDLGEYDVSPDITKP